VIAPAVLLPVVDEMLRFARGRLAKAALPAAIAARDALVEPFAADIAAYFEAMGKRVLGTVHKALEIGWDPADDVDWTIEDAELTTVLARWYTTLGETAFAAVADQLAVELRWDLSARPVAAILDRVGAQVVGISETSRQLLAGIVQRATEQGLSIEQLIPLLEEAFTSWSTGRAATVALTETANAYNLASAAGYAASGLVDEVEIFDGAECGWDGHDDPDLADGSIRTLEEFTDMPTSHPNCQRAAGPVVVR
jgi:hypothetical protein